jgi:very-short-patch-repair endonuclease
MEKFMLKYKINKEELEDLYINKKMSIRQIAKLYSVRYNSIQYWLIKFNIPIRSLSEADKLVKRKINKTKFVCEYCGKEFKEYKSNRMQKHIFCSHKCYSSWRTGKKYEELFGEGAKELRKIKKEQFKKLLSDPKIREKIYTSEWRNKQSLIRKNLWQNSEYRKKVDNEKVKRKRLEGLLKRPTSFEMKIIWLISNYKLPFKYVGNGQEIIGGMNPDFIECNGKKLLIETYCKYWHPKDYEQKRAERFSKYGFKVLFLNDDDFSREDWKEHCLNKIKNFISSF